MSALTSLGHPGAGSRRSRANWPGCLGCNHLVGNYELSKEPKELRRVPVGSEVFAHSVRPTQIAARRWRFFRRHWSRRFEIVGTGVPGTSERCSRDVNRTRFGRVGHDAATVADSGLACSRALLSPDVPLLCIPGTMPAKVASSRDGAECPSKPNPPLASISPAELRQCRLRSSPTSNTKARKTATS